jgi:hypothetical protein
LTRRHRWLKRVVDTDSRERARMVDRAWCGNYRVGGAGVVKRDELRVREGAEMVRRRRRGCLGKGCG